LFELLLIKPNLNLYDKIRIYTCTSAKRESGPPSSRCRSGPDGPGPAPGALGGPPEACIWGAKKSLAKSIILMFETRTDSRIASVTSPCVTRPHHSNLYGKFERFVRFLRVNNAQTESSLCKRRWWMASVDCVRGLRPWIAPVGLGVAW